MEREQVDLILQPVLVFHVTNLMHKEHFIVLLFFSLDLYVILILCMCLYTKSAKTRPEEWIVFANCKEAKSR